MMKSPAVAKTAFVAIVFKMNQLSRKIEGADSKSLSSQLVLLGAMIALAINTINSEQ
jgi:hypothetical protein